MIKPFTFLAGLTLLFVGCGLSPEPQTHGGFQITPWKYNAEGAYSMIFDDYCMEAAHGIGEHAAREANQRDIVFGFGIVTGDCDAADWQRAREMLAQGHEPVNHSHSHRCGQYYEDWCPDVWTLADADLEIDHSGELIAKHLGVAPSFFIFPFDLHTRGLVDHLRDQGYLGTRAGKKQVLESADFSDPFALNFDVKFPDESAAGSQGYSNNGFVDAAIAEGKLAFRAFHGVEDESWGRLRLDELREHFDYVQQKNQSYELWTATISDIIRYREARSACHIVQQGRGDRLRLSLDGPNCEAGLELSVWASALGPGDLIAEDGTPAAVVNGTFTLVSGRDYRVAQ